MAALLAFVIVGLFTPGPNIILLTASGARFGFRRTIPHLAGIALGVGLVAAAAGWGVAAALTARPTLEFSLKCLAAAWILWLALQLARGAAGRPADSNARPFTMAEAVLFQAVNPKVWAIALAAAAGYPVGGPLLVEGLRLGLIFMAVNIMVCTFWTMAGEQLGRLLGSTTAWRRFMWVMAGLLALSATLVFI